MTLINVNIYRIFVKLRLPFVLIISTVGGHDGIVDTCYFSSTILLSIYHDKYVHKEFRSTKSRFLFLPRTQGHPVLVPGRPKQNYGAYRDIQHTTHSYSPSSLCLIILLLLKRLIATGRTSRIDNLRYRFASVYTATVECKRVIHINQSNL